MIDKVLDVDSKELEKQIAHEVKNVIDLNIKELDYYEKQVQMLNLEISLARSINKLEEIETMFVELKNKIIEVIQNYKNIDATDLPIDIEGKIGDYILNNKNKYIIAKVTHRIFDIPDIIRKIIELEAVKENVEQSINQKKLSMIDSSKKWETYEAQKFNINNEIMKMKKTFENQKEYIENIKKNIVFATENNKIASHLKGIDDMSKKIETGSKAFYAAPIDQINIIGMSVTIAMIDNLTKGLETVIMLENKDNYINAISYEEEVRKNTNDFDLIIVVLQDTITNLQNICEGFNTDFKNCVEHYLKINEITQRLIDTSIKLNEKLITIKNFNKKIKEEKI